MRARRDVVLGGAKRSAGGAPANSAPAEAGTEGAISTLASGSGSGVGASLHGQRGRADRRVRADGASDRSGDDERHLLRDAVEHRLALAAANLSGAHARAGRA